MLMRIGFRHRVGVEGFTSAGRGFTLVELLVTISIVTVLAALLLAGYKNVSQKSLIAQCAGNLRQLGIAAGQYAQDNNGNLPLSYDVLLGVNGEPSPGLIDLLGGYVENRRAFYCTDTVNCFPPPARPLALTYNYQAAQTGTDRFRLIGYYWLVATCPTFNAMAYDNPPHKIIGSSMRVLATCPHFDGGNAHNRNYNVLFADGHVNSVKPDSNGNLLNYISPESLRFVAPYN
jgi:prepilin-type N-terminal cleavage/methylation domain-containing protein/prepilin-type processing-associated H-X9-DG protein